MEVVPFVRVALPNYGNDYRDGDEPHEPALNTRKFQRGSRPTHRRGRDKGRASREPRSRTFACGVGTAARRASMKFERS